MILSDITCFLILNGRFSCDMREQEVHSEILTVQIFVHFVSDSLRHNVTIEVRVVLKNTEHNNVKIYNSTEETCVIIP